MEVLFKKFNFKENWHEKSSFIFKKMGSANFLKVPKSGLKPLFFVQFSQKKV